MMYGKVKIKMKLPDASVGVSSGVLSIVNDASVGELNPNKIKNRPQKMEIPQKINWRPRGLKKHADKKPKKIPRGFLICAATLLHVFNSVGFLFLWAKVASKFV